MAHTQKLIFTVLVLLVVAAKAEWRALFSRAGFYGRYAIGLSYEWHPEHAADLLLGSYHIDNHDYHQTNLAYRYSRWHVGIHNHIWRPLQFGIFTSRSWDKKHYFLKSPTKYPYTDYYDQTAFRSGLEISTTISFFPSRLALAYHFRILDTGIIAIYNNSSRDLQYYISSGFSLQYLF